MFRVCIKCGRIFEGTGSRCAEHPNRWRSGSTRERRRTRERILVRDGYRCTVHVRPGQRCVGTKLLEVHHIYGEENDVLLVPGDELRTVCRRHNPRGDRAGGTLAEGRRASAFRWGWLTRKSHPPAPRDGVVGCGFA